MRMRKFVFFIAILVMANFSTIPSAQAQGPDGDELSSPIPTGTNFSNGRLISKDGKWLAPVASVTLSSDEDDHLSRKSVNAWDLSAQYGSPVYPMAEGTVIYAGCNNAGGYGCWALIDHGEYTSVYAHMINKEDKQTYSMGHVPNSNGTILVSTGQKVDQNTQLGRVGWTGLTSFGPHTHWEIRENSHQIRLDKFFDKSKLIVCDFCQPKDWQWQSDGFFITGQTDDRTENVSIKPLRIAWEGFKISTGVIIIIMISFLYFLLRDKFITWIWNNKEGVPFKKIFILAFGKSSEIVILALIAIISGLNGWWWFLSITIIIPVFFKLYIKYRKPIHVIMTALTGQAWVTYLVEFCFIILILLTISPNVALAMPKQFPAFNFAETVWNDKALPGIEVTAEMINQANKLGVNAETLASALKASSYIRNTKTGEPIGVAAPVDEVGSSDQISWVLLLSNQAIESSMESSKVDVYVPNKTGGCIAYLEFGKHPLLNEPAEKKALQKIAEWNGLDYKKIYGSCGAGAIGFTQALPSNWVNTMETATCRDPWNNECAMEFTARFHTKNGYFTDGWQTAIRRYYGGGAENDGIYLNPIKRVYDRVLAKVW